DLGCGWTTAAIVRPQEQRSVDAGDRQRGVQYLVGIEVLLGDPPCCLAVGQIVRVHRADMTRRLLECPKREQSLAGRKPRLEAGGLDDRRLAGGEIAPRPIADPATARLDVAGLRDAELAA